MATSPSRRRIPVALGALAGLALAGGVLAACGDDGSGSASTSATTVTTPATTTTVAPATTARPTTTAAPATTARPTTTATAPPTTTDGVARIVVTVGVDDAGTTGSRVDRVTTGRDVELTVIPATSEELHLHGYDLEQQGTAGQPVVFRFTADLAGSFELEGHDSGTVFTVLEVA